MATDYSEFVAALPSIRLKPGAHKRVKGGHPWVFSNEIIMDAAAKALPPGGAVRLEAHTGHFVAVAGFNPKPLISGRVLSMDPTLPALDAGFFRARLQQALAMRDAFFPAPFYRLVHAEADGFPGLIVDRYGDVLAMQVNSAVMEAFTPQILEALDDLLSPETVLLRNDSPARTMEGLQPSVRFHRGDLHKPVELMENGCVFFADLREGQKTGWFYDQRDNRAFMARLSPGKRVLDVYGYTGGFAVAAAVAGAEEVITVDRSALAHEMAGKAAERNGVADKVKFHRGEAFGMLEKFGSNGELFDVVIVDPPAFVKAKKDFNQGSRGYRKMVKLAAPLVKPGGWLLAASCSHHMPPDQFERQVAGGLTDARRQGRIVLQSGAAPDHPVHPHLPESAYLKAVVCCLD